MIKLPAKVQRLSQKDTLTTLNIFFLQDQECQLHNWFAYNHKEMSATCNIIKYFFLIYVLEKIVADLLKKPVNPKTEHNKIKGVQRKQQNTTQTASSQKLL